MAAAAYGAVGSLMHLLYNLQHPSRQQLQYDRDQIKTLCENATFLLEFLEDYSEILCHTETEDLARQLAYAVDEAEEIIDCHVVDQLSQRSAYEGLSSFREDMDNVLNKIESIRKELMMMVEDRKLVANKPQQRVSQPIIGGSSTPPSRAEINKMVGFDEHLDRIMDRLTGHEVNIMGDVYECKMHDLLRDLCKREYEKEHFFRFSKVGNNSLQSPTDCFLCSYREASEEMIHFPHVSSISPQPTTLATCFVCKVCNILCAQHDRLRLVMIEADGLDVKYLKSSRVRYLEVGCELESTSLSLLWNLQYLETFNSYTVMPVGILWEMPQLRTLITRDTILVDPPVTQICSEDYVILENLQILSATNFRGSEEILKRIPNVKTLSIEYDYYEQSEEVVPPTNPLLKVVDLHKLETFHCEGVDLECMSFPNSLKFLRLEDCSYPWERMTIIGSLPNLEILMLDTSLGGGPEWNPIAGEYINIYIYIKGIS